MLTQKSDHYHVKLAAHLNDYWLSISTKPYVQMGLWKCSLKIESMLLIKEPTRNKIKALFLVHWFLTLALKSLILLVLKFHMEMYNSVHIIHCLKSLEWSILFIYGRTENDFSGHFTITSQYFSTSYYIYYISVVGQN